MTKREIYSGVEKTICLLDQAIKEREEELRSLLYACHVSNIFDIDSLEQYKLGAEISNQIDTLKDLADELKYQIPKIGTFQEV